MQRGACFCVVADRWTTYPVVGAVVGNAYTVKRRRGEPGDTRDTQAHTRTHGGHRRTSQASKPNDTPARPHATAETRNRGRLNSSKNSRRPGADHSPRPTQRGRTVPVIKSPSQSVSQLFHGPAARAHPSTGSRVCPCVCPGSPRCLFTTHGTRGRTRAHGSHARDGRNRMIPRPTQQPQAWSRPLPAADSEEAAPSEPDPASHVYR